MRLIKDGEKGGKGVWRWREREIIYLSRYRTEVLPLTSLTPYR